MSTEKTSTTNSANTYAPGALGNYQAWAGQLFPQLSQMFSNPTKSPFFTQQLQQNQKAAGQTSGLQSKNALTNFQMSGIGGGSMGGGAYQSLLAGLGRNSSQNAYSAWNSTMNNANQNMWNAGSLGSSFFGNPLVTGGNSTNKQTTGGLGTWLPQVLGAGLGIASGGLFGGGAGATSGPFNLASGLGASQASGIANSANQNFIGGMNTSMPSATSFLPSGTSPFLTGMG